MKYIPSLHEQVTMDETEEVQWTDDEHAIVELLRSMGVTKFDSSVPAALNEYAKRMFLRNYFTQQQYDITFNKITNECFYFKLCRICIRTLD